MKADHAHVAENHLKLGRYSSLRVVGARTPPVEEGL
jgi:hypothetical protein